MEKHNISTITVQNVSVSELTRLISEQIQKDIQRLSIKLKELDKEKTKPHMTLKETALFFGISKQTIYSWITQGLITPYKVSGKVFFSKSECIELILGKQAA